MTDDNDNPRGRVVQRWHATGDYAFPAEEAENGEFVEFDDYAAIVAERDALRAEVQHWKSRATVNLSELDRLREKADRAERLAEALRRAYQAAYLRQGHSDDLLAALDRDVDAALAAEGRP